MSMFAYIQWDITECLIFLLVFMITYMYMSSRSNLPPGPRSYPGIGSVGFMRTLAKHQPHKAFAEEADKYGGGILSVWMGPKLLVILNGYDTIHKAFVEHADDFVDRPNWLPQLKKIVEKGAGLSWSNGEEWKVIRKFSLTALRKFGVGQQTTEDKIMAEVKEVCHVLRGQTDEPVSISKLLQHAVSDVICTFIFGQRFDYNDSLFNEFLDRLDFIVKDDSLMHVTDILPEFMHPLFPTAYKLLLKKRENDSRMEQILDSFIEAHKQSFNESNVRDFIDLYIGTLSEHEQESTITYLHKGNVYRVIMDLFLAGSETTSTALDWAFLYMIEYPTVQTNCRDAIEKHVGQRPVKLSDRKALAYVEAVVQEVLRLSNVAPMGVPHTCADHDIVIDGYTIPKRTLIMPNLYSAHVDLKYWTDPFEFKPERFLDGSGHLVKKEAFIPMSLGPRVCAGERLARAQLFLIFTSLLQEFEFKREDESIKHDFSNKAGQFVTLAPKPYKIRVNAVK